MHMRTEDEGWQTESELEKSRVSSELILVGRYATETQGWNLMDRGEEGCTICTM